MGCSPGFQAQNSSEGDYTKEKSNCSREINFDMSRWAFSGASSPEDMGHALREGSGQTKDLYNAIVKASRHAYVFGGSLRLAGPSSPGRGPKDNMFTSKMPKSETVSRGLVSLPDSVSPGDWRWLK